jgi:hypothetical protein
LYITLGNKKLWIRWRLLTVSQSVRQRNSTLQYGNDAGQAAGDMCVFPLLTDRVVKAASLFEIHFFLVDFMDDDI